MRIPPVSGILAGHLHSTLRRASPEEVVKIRNLRMVVS